MNIDVNKLNKQQTNKQKQEDKQEQEEQEQALAIYIRRVRYIFSDILGECALQRTDDNNNEKLIFELFHSNDHILIRKILDRIRDSLLYNFL